MATPLRRFHILLFAASLLLAGCAHLPDTGRAAAALQQGDRAAAEAQYRALAEFGLPGAQLALGDLLANGPARERQLAEAITWYERAARRDARGLGRISGLYARDPALDASALDALTERLQARHARGELQLSADIADLLLARGNGRNAREVERWARQAARIGDPRGEYLLGMLCDQPLREMPDVPCAARHYSASAAQLPEAAGALVALAQRHNGVGLPLQLAREAAARHAGAARHSVFRVYRKKVGGVPQLSVAEVLLGGLFRRDARAGVADATQAAAIVEPEMEAAAATWDPTDAAVELANAYAANVGEDARTRLLDLLAWLRTVRPLEADLIEAEVYTDGNLLPSDPLRAQALLRKHADTSPAAAYAYGGLLRSGMLDEPDYAGAVQWFERAGEGGLAKSWFILTRLYLYSPGFAPDRARAEAYAARARENGYVMVDALLDSAAAGVTP
ncbi:MAG: Sel1 protein [Moraxellaceae bacterium]|nr:Sel1 protein [Moraxellaceae bacterium]